MAGMMAEGRELAEQLLCQFIEASAKMRINVDESFFKLVQGIKLYDKVSRRLSFCIR